MALLRNTYQRRVPTGLVWRTAQPSMTDIFFIADNGGNLMCLNLNTLQLVWVQDVLDDSNSTPVLSVEDGHLYLYVSTSFRLGGEAAPLQRFLSGKLMRRQERSSGRPLMTVPPRTVFRAVYSLPSLLEKKNCRITFM